MMLKKLIGTVVLWSFPIVANACPLAQIRVGLFDFPPLYYQTESGHIEGTLVRLLDRMVQEAGCSWREHFYADVPSLAKSLISGELDLIMAIRHPLMEKKSVYGSVPLTQLQLNLYHHPDTPAAIAPWALKGKRVAVIRGYGYGGVIDQLLVPEAGIKLFVAAGHHEAFALLMEGRVDYVLDYRGPAEALLASHADVPLARSHWSTQDLFLIVSKQLAYPDALIETLEQALGRIQ